jgi:hypothetical protein
MGARIGFALLVLTITNKLAFQYPIHADAVVEIAISMFKLPV